MLNFGRGIFSGALLTLIYGGGYVRGGRLTSHDLKYPEDLSTCECGHLFREGHPEKSEVGVSDFYWRKF